MRRVLGLILVTLVLLAGVAGALVWGVARIGPETLRRRTEAQLEQLLHTEVALGPVELRVSRAGLVVSAGGLRAWPTPRGPMLDARRLEFQLDLWSLLAGQVDLGWVALEGADVRLRREGRGLALDVAPPDAGAAASPRPGGRSAPEPVGGAAPAAPPLERLLEQVPQVELRQSRALVAAGPGPAPELSLEELDGWLARRWIRGGVGFELTGALRSRGEAAGRFALEGSGGGGGRLQATVQVDELALRPAASLAPAPVLARTPEGRASGRIDVAAGAAKPIVVSVDLAAPRLRLRATEKPFELRSVRLAGTATGAPIAANATRWRVDGRASAAGVSAPLAATAVQRAGHGVEIEEVRVGAPLELERLGPLLAALPEPARSVGREIERHLKSGRLLDAQLAWRPGSHGRELQASGRVEALALEADGGRLEEVGGSYTLEHGTLTLAGAGGRFAGEPAGLAALWPEAGRARARAALAPIRAGRVSGLELRVPLAAGRTAADVELRTRVHEARVRIGARSELDGLGGDVELRGGKLSLVGVSARLDGRPLPRLDATLAGLPHLAQGFHCVRPEPVPPLPGRTPLAEWIRGPADAPRGPPSWRSVRVEADFLAHPALGCVADAVVAQIEPAADGGFHVRIERALWGGLALAGEAQLRPAPEDQVRLDVRLGPHGAGARQTAPSGAWGQGRFALESQRLGSWDVRGASGRFRLEADALSFSDARLALAPGPDVEVTDLALSLARPDGVPFRAGAQVKKGEFGDFLVAITDATEPTVSGPFTGGIDLRGALRPGHPTLQDAEAGFSVNVRDGMIRQRFRLFLAVAMASETLNPFRERGTIRFRAMDIAGRLQGGAWGVDVVNIDGPALRVAANLRVAAMSPNEVEGVMALFFFRTVDRAIGAVPLVNRMLLGKDKNLLGTYVALSGPWNAMHARVLPVRTIARGPASVVVEGVPTALEGGVRVIQRILGATALPSVTSRVPRPARPSLPRVPLGSGSKENADS